MGSFVALLLGSYFITKYANPIENESNSEARIRFNPDVLSIGGASAQEVPVHPSTGQAAHQPPVLPPARPLALPAEAQERRKSKELKQLLNIQNNMLPMDAFNEPLAFHKRD